MEAIAGATLLMPRGRYPAMQASLVPTVCSILLLSPESGTRPAPMLESQIEFASEETGNWTGHGLDLGLAE